MLARRARDDVTLLLDHRTSPLQFTLQLRNQVACLAELTRENLALNLARRYISNNGESVRIAILDARRSWRRSNGVCGF